jgi:DNA-binding CsgD family transcriptional regulator
MDIRIFDVLCPDYLGLAEVFRSYSHMGGTMSQQSFEKEIELKTVQIGIEILSQSTNAQDLCRRIAHAEFMDGFCHGVAVYLLDRKSMLIEVASYGRAFDFGTAGISTWDDNVMSHAVRSRKIVEEQAVDVTLYALPIELSGVTTGAFLFTLAEKVPTPVFSRQVTSMLANLGGLFMDSKGLTLKETVANAQNEEHLTSISVQELTSRQLKILELVADGLTNAAIARLVLLSESTVRQETIRIFRVLQCHSRTEAIVKARAIGLLPRVSQSFEMTN